MVKQPSLGGGGGFDSSAHDRLLLLAHVCTMGLGATVRQYRRFPLPPAHGCWNKVQNELGKSKAS